MIGAPASPASATPRTGWEHMDRAEALKWVHLDTPLVTDPLTAAAGTAVRQAALAFYSQVQQVLVRRDV